MVPQRILPALGAIAALGFATGAVVLLAAPESDPQSGWLPGPFESVPSETFINWETPQVSPLDMTADGRTLLAVNTADARLEVFSLASGLPRHIGSVPVGLDPVSVRARSESEAWVVNHLSDSISIVDLNAMNVVRTIATADEPADVVFAGSPRRAFVTCSQANLVQVFDVDNPSAAIASIPIEGEDPRAMAVSPDGSRVYAAVFESGNGSTILGGGLTMGAGAYPPNVVSDALGPYGGVNPPPNAGAAFSPPVNAANPVAPRVGVIVKKDDQSRWMDDNGGDWTNLVSGAQAARSGRLPGWDLVDQDLAVIDASTFGVQYATRLMNACMAVGVNPATGEIAVVGTDATNDIRFEPNLNGRFVRVHAAVVNPATLTSAIVDLNSHLAYPPGPSFTPIPQSERDRSVGDPRGIVFGAAGDIAYISGMGSDNVLAVDASGQRIGDPIRVGAGPTGLVLDDDRERLYVLNRFDGSISVVDTALLTETARVPFFDPTPDPIKNGRRHFYNTQLTSGLGQASCASCHIDARFDRLAWDLGDPSGAMKTFNQNCPDNGCTNWHPMKGPMSTQSLQDIIHHEPHHWRGDRDGLEEFNGAFTSLLGDDVALTPQEMQEFEDFLASIYYPPNPYRNFDNTLPSNLPLPGHFTTGRFGAAGLPLPNGNAVRGLNAYRTSRLDAVDCVTCHTLPTGMGPNGRFVGLQFVPIPPGPNGEEHHGLVSVDGSTNISIKVPQLRNVYEKTGFNTTQLRNTAGFGYLHDGSVDSIERFVGEPVFSVTGNQMVADLTAFMLSFAGSQLPVGSTTNPLQPLGPVGQDTHAAVGAQTTVAGPPDAAQTARLNAMLAQADVNRVGIVVKGIYLGEARGFYYIGGGMYQSDRAAQSFAHASLTSAAGLGAELTWTVVPTPTAARIGADRDQDGYLDRDELDACANPADAASTPVNSTCCPADLTSASDPNDPGYGVPDHMIDASDFFYFLDQFASANLTVADLTGSSDPNDPSYGMPDGAIDASDFFYYLDIFVAGCP